MPAQLPTDFEASVSWTFHVPANRLFAAWNARPPLAGGHSVRKATSDKSLWATWAVGTNIEASFLSRGESESQLTIRHSKLQDAEHVAATAEFWRNDILRELALSINAGAGQRETGVMDMKSNLWRRSERRQSPGAGRRSYRYAAQRDAAGKMMRATYLIFAAITALISVRFVLMAIGMDPHEAFTAFILSVTAPFARPSIALFTTLEVWGVGLELPSLVAIFSYALLGWLSGRFVLLLFSGPSDVVPVAIREMRE